MLINKRQKFGILDNRDLGFLEFKDFEFKGRIFFLRYRGDIMITLRKEKNNNFLALPVKEQSFDQANECCIDQRRSHLSSLF